MFQVHDSFEDVVTQHYDPALDGDDADPPEARVSRLAQLTQPFAQLRALRPAPAVTSTLVVPYVQVGEGAHDSDAVYGIKRAYARSVSAWRLRDLMAKPLEVRRSWGPRFSDEFGQKQYTRTRHQLLAPYFDAFAISLMHTAPVVSARDKQIALQLGWHTALYNRRMSVLYSQIRPSQLGPATLITRADCSGSVAGGCDWANILPNVDWRYTNTWAQITFGSGVSSVRYARKGDVFLYGSPSHEALYVGNGLVWSFGSYPIKILPHDYRHDRVAIRRFVPL
jgi:hypothetical protein